MLTMSPPSYAKCLRAGCRVGVQRCNLSKEKVDYNPVYTVSISQTCQFQDSMVVPVEICGLGSCTV